MNILRGAALGAAVILAAPTADAAIFDISFEGTNGAQAFDTPVGLDDGVVISGLLKNGAGAVSNTTSFILGAGVTGLELDAVWRSGAAGDLFRLVGVNIDLLDSSATVIASDDFQGVLSGFAVSLLSAVALTPGAEYSIVLTGTNQNVGKYLIDITFVPVPAAALLLAPALAGLGYVGYRRRTTA